jgi:hypothetical protein
MSDFSSIAIELARLENTLELLVAVVPCWVGAKSITWNLLSIDTTLSIQKNVSKTKAKRGASLQK